MISKENTSCYDTFTEAVAFATGGRITDAPNDTAAAMADPGLTRRINALSQNSSARPTVAEEPNVISIEYEHDKYSGRSYTFMGNGTGCGRDHDITYQVSSLSGVGMNEMISSYIAYDRCFVKHYEHDNFSGKSTDWLFWNLYIEGYMNDRTSSIKWK
ncbi:hypothetical protein ACFYY8_24010 [Streptosporangium sp. NPDC001559]|uniref:hypothetical protein n=1 Tax=Streptosporangium sp. NPDC001559 TaxID=3366187 RepID=UPI0036E9BCED